MENRQKKIECGQEERIQKLAEQLLVTPQNSKYNDNIHIFKERKDR